MHLHVTIFSFSAQMCTDSFPSAGAKIFESLKNPLHHFYFQRTTRNQSLLHMNRNQTKLYELRFFFPPPPPLKPSVHSFRDDTRRRNGEDAGSAQLLLVGCWGAQSPAAINTHLSRPSVLSPSLTPFTSPRRTAVSPRAGADPAAFQS